MGSSIKLLRGQVRQIVQELLPQVLKDEILKALNRQINERLDSINRFVDNAVKEMNERSKETQSYVVRNLALSNALATQSKVEESTVKPEL